MKSFRYILIALTVMQVHACKRSVTDLDLRELNTAKNDDLKSNRVDEKDSIIETPLESVADPKGQDPSVESKPNSIAATVEPSFQILENEALLRCPAFKSIKKENTEFQVIHKAIGDEVIKGTNVLKPGICEIRGTAKIPAGYTLNFSLKHTEVDTEPYLHKDDSSNFSYTIKSTLNGEEFFSRFFGSNLGTVESSTKVTLEQRNSKPMNCASAKNEEKTVSFSYVLDYALYSKIADPDDTVGNFIVTSPTVLLLFEKCP